MKILIIRYKAIGDVLLTSTICSSLRKSFPDSQIDYLVYSASYPLLENNKDIDNVIRLTSKQTKNPLKYLAAAWQITRTRYDVVIDATSTHKSALLSLFSLHAKYRIGRKKSRRSFFYTHTIKAVSEDKIEQKMELLKPLSDDGYNIVYDKNIRIDLSENEKKSALNRIVSDGVDLNRPIFAFSVSSKYSHKMWNLDYMKEVAEHCLSKHNAQIVVLSGMPHEREIIEKLKQQLDNNPSVFNSIEAPSLRDLAVLLSCCDLFFGNEGAPRHIAEAVDVPTVCVTSPSIDGFTWVRTGRREHQCVGWKDILVADKEIRAAKKVVSRFHKVRENDFPEYTKLYDVVKPSHVIVCIDDVIASKKI